MSSEDKQASPQQKKPRASKRGKAKEVEVPAHQRKSAGTRNQPHSDLGQSEKCSAWSLGGTRWHDPITLFTAVLALVGITQVWAFIASERAFLSVGGLKFANGLVANQKVELIVMVANSGRTTGFIEDLNVTIKFLDRGHTLPPKPEYKEGAEMAPGNIIPGRHVSIPVTFEGLHGQPHLIVNEADIALFNSGARLVYFYGFVSYQDAYSVFGSKVTGYCYLYNPNAPSLAFTNCNERAYTYAH